MNDPVKIDIAVRVGRGGACHFRNDQVRIGRQVDAERADRYGRVIRLHSILVNVVFGISSDYDPVISLDIGGENHRMNMTVGHAGFKGV